MTAPDRMSGKVWKVFVNTVIKENNSCVITADEQVGGAKKIIFTWFSQFIHICSEVTSDNDCIYRVFYPFN